MEDLNRMHRGAASGARVVAAVYAAAAGLWILLSDWVVSALVLAPATQDTVQTIKGWLFVAATSLLLYFVLRRQQAARAAARQREKAVLAEQARGAALLQALVENSSDAIFAKDREGRYLLFNREAARITGVAAEQALGKDDALLFPAAQAQMIRANDGRVMALERTQTFEEEIDTRQGKATYLATKGPLRSDEGVIGLFGVSRDITAMVLARQALVESERRYRSLFESNPHPMWVFDVASLRFLDVNAAAVAQYGYSRDEFLRMTLYEIRPPEHAAALDGDLQPREAGVEYGMATSGPWVHRRKDGSTIEVEISSNDLEVDGRHARLVLAFDVTERQRLLRERDAADAARDRAFEDLARREAELGRSELRFRLASLGGHVWDWDIAGQRADYPSAFWVHLGYEPPREDAPAFLAQIMPSEDRARWRAALRAHLTQRAPYALEFRARDAAGRWHWFHTRGQAVWNADGRATYMAGTTFDVTDRHAAELALVRARQQLSELSQRLLRQERESSTRLAHVLHDRLGQTLASARLQLDLALSHARGAGDGLAGRLARVSAMVDEATADVRNLLVDLRPPLLSEQGLAAAIDNELQRSRGHDLGVRMALAATAAATRARWPDAVEYAAFMIAREAIGNALRHAGAAELRVALDGDGSWLRLDVRDDGSGIDLDRLAGEPGHLGLVGMRERANAIAAALSVRRLADRGTAVGVDWRSPAP